MRQRWQSWAAWWSGDLEALRRDTPATAPGGYWWRRNKPGASQIHVPLGSDLARTTAELMYGDTPVTDFEAGEEFQNAWEELSQTIGWANTLLESGEVGGALGGSYLKPAWDSETADHPLLMVVRGDQALPEFRFNTLHAVTFVTELAPPADWTSRNRHEVWRWLEHHEPGQIRHELWLGSVGNIGNPLTLNEHPHTKFLEGVIDTRGIRPKGILVEFIPCDLPQPLDMLPIGRSVMQGVETLLDQLDEVWDSWMRDFRIGKGRVLLSKEMLDPIAGPQKRSALGGLFSGRKNTTAGSAFDVDAEAFVGLEMSPEGKDGAPAPITLNQFAIRMQEHYETAMAIVQEIVSRAGFAPQTFGINVDGQLSGTAMRRRELRSHRTKDRMRRYARPKVERIAETIMLINAELFNGPKPKKRPTLKWRDSDGADPKETAETVQLLRNALVMSVEEGVRTVHPEWDDKQVGLEVGRLLQEQAALTAPALDGTEPAEPAEGEPLAAGEASKEQVEKFRSLWLSGVEPQEAARQAGMGPLTMVANPRPVTVAPDKDDAEPAAPPVPGQPPKPFPPGR